MTDFFLGVMNLQEAKNHQLKLKQQGISVELKTNNQTCTTGCKVTVELWGNDEDRELLQKYFDTDFLKHVSVDHLNLEQIAAVFDPNAEEVICQACGTKFSPVVNECPDCGLMY